MDEALKSDSSDMDAKAKDQKGASTRKKELEDVKECLKDGANATKEELATGNQHAKELIDQCKKEALHKEWDVEERKWQSLTNFVTKCEDAFEVNEKAVSLKPLSMRIQKLEKEPHQPDFGSMFDVSPFKDFKVPDVDEDEER